ncbi:MAG: 4Fe-4S dicluster domain-containing protein [Bacillota bacterium]
MTRLGFYFDMTSCVGCRTCEIACKDKNNLQVGIVFRQVSTFETGSFPNPGVFHYSGACNHCANPKCVEGCPTGAMHISDDGTIQHDSDKCIGCRYCVWNCPYGAPKFIPETGKVAKCDSCKDLRDKGENPACVDACMMRALEWGDIDELKRKHAGEELTNDLPILETSTISEPALIINIKPVARQKDYREKVV